MAFCGGVFAGWVDFNNDEPLATVMVILVVTFLLGMLLPKKSLAMGSDGCGVRSRGIPVRPQPGLPTHQPAQPGMVRFAVGHYPCPDGCLRRCHWAGDP
ncbi:MAG: hypothetical protein FIA98_10345 [Anaerolineae bacterium]|nr:hypothetical protein [Anaerolineae bacterium]